jgi:transcriptional regulator with XRE-family HTH domain
MSAVPRPEVEIAGGTPEGDFALGLRALRAEAGLGYQALARIAHFAPSTLSKAASGRGLPSLEVTLAYVRACGGSEEQWEADWRDLRAALRRPPSTAGAQESRLSTTTVQAQAADPPPPGLDSGRTALRTQHSEAIRPIPHGTLCSVKERRGASRSEWLVRSLLALVCVLLGMSITVVLKVDRAVPARTVAPVVLARSSQSLEAADGEFADLFLAVGRTTQWVNLKNPNSTDIVVTELRPKIDDVPDSSAWELRRCYWGFTKFTTVQKAPYPVDAYGITQIVVVFEVLPDIPDDCKGRTVRVSYVSEAFAGTIVEGKAQASRLATG